MKKFEELKFQFENGLNLETSTYYLMDDIEDYTIQNFLTFVEMLAIKKPDIKEVNLFLNSAGGSVPAMVCFLDIAEYLKKEKNILINSYAFGTAHSAAAIILAMSTGTRYASKNSMIMFHEISFFTAGSTTKLKRETEAIEKLQGRIIKQLSEKTGQTFDFWKDAFRDETWLFSEEAIELNVIDKII